ncbi:MAG: M28 family peptidase [Myxococcaceae bacterium]
MSRPRYRVPWLLVFLAACSVVLAACFSQMVRMPGTSWPGEPGAVTDPALEASLRADVTTLAVDIGERNLDHFPASLERTAAWLTERLKSLGYEVVEQPYPVGERTVKNLVVEKKGKSKPSEIIVVGAHYDSAPGTPGADDNGSGVAVALRLAQVMASRTPERTVRFLFFTNEEPPWFRTASMGSEVAAKATRARGDDVKVMLSLETMGYFSSAPNTQHYPWPFSVAYPSTGHFIAFVADTGSREVLHQVITTFRERAKLPSEGASVPAFIEGVDWSDHGPYWRQDYRAMMVTDTAPFRNPNYHEKTDLPDTLDYRRLALTAEGLEAVLEVLSK